MFDVKLNSSHSLNEIWHQPGARGNLFNLISQRTDIAVLHLERSNIFAQAISERIAEKTGVWHLEPGQARSESNRVTIAPGSILKRLIELDQGAELLRASVRGMRSCVTLQYEGLFADGSLAPVAREKIASVTGASLPDRCEVALTKVVGNLKHSIRNWESVVDFFDGTDYADLARHTFE
jgi:LPS sulfotransferase NodH